MEPRAAMKATTLLIKRSSTTVNLRQNPRKINDLAIICGASRSARSTWNNANFLWGGTVGSPHLRHPSVQLARSMGHPTARRHSRPSATGPAAPAGTPPSHHQAQQTRTPCSLAGELEPTARTYSSPSGHQAPARHNSNQAALMGTSTTTTAYRHPSVPATGQPGRLLEALLSQCVSL